MSALPPPSKGEYLGVYMAADRDIVIRDDMLREDMWFVLKALMAEYEAVRSRHQQDLEFMTRLAKRG
jgi:hypothetical protein